MLMYSRYGGINVSDLDAIATCQRHPAGWTLVPWIRPDGRPDVTVPPDWDTRLGGGELVALARSTFPDNGAHSGIADPAAASSAIIDYLERTTRPANGDLK
jgi:hypothetical protein